MGVVKLIQLIIAVAYFVIFSIIFGAIAKRKVKTGQDYFTAANRLTWPLVMCTFVLSPLGSGHTSSLWEQQTFMGISVLWWGILAGSVFVPIFMLWFGPWLRRLKVETFPQGLAKLFGKKIGFYNASIAPAAWLGIAISEVLGTATAIYCLTAGRIPFTPGCVVIAGILCVVYMLFAGQLQASYMNVINAIMLIAGSFIAVVYLGGWLKGTEFGGFQGIADWYAGNGNGWMTNIFHVDSNILLGIMFPVVILHVFAASSEHCMYLPVLAAKNTREIRKGAFPAAMINSLAAFPWVILGVCSVAIVGMENTTAKLCVPDLLLKAFPPALIGVVMVSLLCANLSTASALLLSMSHVVTDDIFRPLCGEKISEKGYYRLGVFLVVVCTILAVIPALNAPVVLPLFFWCFSIGLPLFICYFLGMVWRVNRKAAWVTCLASLGVNFWWTFACPIAEGPFTNSYYPVLACAFILYFVLAVCLPGSKPAMLKRIREQEAAERKLKSASA